MSIPLFDDIRMSALLLLGSGGSRILCKYYSPAGHLNIQAQKQLEAQLWQATNHGCEDSVIELDNFIAIYHPFPGSGTLGGGAVGYILIPLSENESIANLVLSCFSTALSTLLEGQVTHDNLLASMDLIQLLCDEILDDGYILELSGPELIHQVSIREISQGLQPVGGGGAVGSSVDHDTTLSAALGMATTAFLRSWRADQ